MPSTANFSTTPLNTDTIRILEIRILNALRNSSGGGGGGSAQLSQGTGAPVAPPTNTATTAIYIDRNTGIQYFWNTTAQAWQ